MADEARPAAQTPHPQSADYSGLAELSYRRAKDANSGHIDSIDGVSAVNPLDNPSLRAAAEAWQPGTDVATFVQAEYGLMIDPEDRGDGLTHFYSRNGFSGFITQRGADTPDPSDDEFIITYRGTDLTDNSDGEMIGGITTAARPLVGAAALGRGQQPSFEEYQAEIVDSVDDLDDFGEFTVRRDNTDQIVERLVDAGDIYTNGLLGQGTYQATQYDDARALFRLVSDHYADDGQDVTTAGQSLGGGLAALIGVEHGLESHTFGMAPFQNQFEIIAQRNAFRQMLADPARTGDFGDLGDLYANASVIERHAMERGLSEDLSRLGTTEGGHSGKTASQRIRDFNARHGTDIDRDTIEAFNARSAANAATYEANKSELYASTVSNEFTTNSGAGSLLGDALTLGSNQIVPTDQLHTYEIGEPQTDARVRDIRDRVLNGDRDWGANGQRATGATRFLGEGLSAHSPALHDLVTASQDSETGAFDDLLQDPANSNLRYYILHNPGLVGGVASGKEGADDDPSASRARATTNETFYRGMSSSLRADETFYDDTYELFDRMGSEGRVAEGAGTDTPEVATLNGAMTQFALQSIRTDLDVHDIPPGSYPTSNGVEGGRFGEQLDAGYIGFDLMRIEAAAEPENREMDADGNRIAGMRGVHGYTDLQTVIYETVRDQVVVPEDRGWVESDAKAIARVTDEVTGARQGFRWEGSEGRFDVPVGRMEIGYAYAQIGNADDGDYRVEDDVVASLNSGQGVAMFMGNGSNVLEGTTAHDYAMMGGGNDDYVSQVSGGALVSGGVGFDTYWVDEDVGRVVMTIDENVANVVRGSLIENGRQADLYTEVDRVVGVERFRLNDGDDTVGINGISGDRVLDGGAGINTVFYTQLDPDYTLDLSDGVTASGTVYSARLSNGESTLYIINVDDENIVGRDGRRASAALEAEAGTDAGDAGSTPMSLRDVVAQMEVDVARARLGIAARAESGDLTAQDLRTGRLMAESGASDVFAALHRDGASQLAIPNAVLVPDAGEETDADVNRRIGVTVSVAAKSLRERGVDLPESEYNASLDPTIPAREMARQNDAAIGNQGVQSATNGVHQDEHDYDLA